MDENFKNLMKVNLETFAVFLQATEKTENTKIFIE